MVFWMKLKYSIVFIDFNVYSFNRVWEKIQVMFDFESGLKFKVMGHKGASMRGDWKQYGLLFSLLGKKKKKKWSGNFFPCKDPV